MSDQCKCDMRTKMVGDGCSVCNPQYYIKILEEQGREQDEELEQLRTENAKLRSTIEDAAVFNNPEDCWVSHKVLEEENAALKAMVNDLILSISRLNPNKIKDYSHLGESYDQIVNKCLSRVQSQSLHDHCAKCTKSEQSERDTSPLGDETSRYERDMVLAEKVREAVYKTGWCSSNIYDDDVLDLTAIVRGEG